MRVLVSGTGFTGLVAALVLAADGHDVTMLGHPLAGGGSPSGTEHLDPVGASHVLLPELLDVLARELPEPARLLLFHGAQRVAPAGSDGAGGSLVISRERARRILLVAASAAPGLTLRLDDGIESLLTGRSRIAGRPHISGVLTTRGEAVFADLVVDSRGDGSPIPGLLSDVGAPRPGEEYQDSGHRLYSVRFRVPEATAEADPWTLTLREGLWAASLASDGGWSLTLCTRDDDEPLYPLAGVAAWRRLVDLYRPSLLPRGAELLSGVCTTLRAESGWRRFVVGGEPIATGVMAVGEAWATCHPLLGIAPSLGTAQALLLRDTLRTAPPGDARATALLLDQATADVLLPVHQRAIGVETRFYDGAEAQVRTWPETIRCQDDGESALAVRTAAEREQPNHILLSRALVRRLEALQHSAGQRNLPSRRDLLQGLAG
ncbi:NAD(P)/FAD-dependent oxidoreductase [Streptomyces sp. NBC_00568]|uniref:NAD(P)/FAD-dependent oxidoreductase n=1 Tax=Streptomyces sp. NBC_00568 TaxID=2975779 RepID=UPI00225A32F5|nr:hypothetical protein [Streptomyces sp. NBC_00568]MCX4993514.1 hypothetical protein [Streptomyces sp. NBC_00568]